MLVFVAHTEHEARFLHIGMINGKVWSAITTNRNEVTRVISVRRSRKNEVLAYENR